jgi:hypothetical protein
MVRLVVPFGGGYVCPDIGSIRLLVQRGQRFDDLRQGRSSKYRATLMLLGDKPGCRARVVENPGAIGMLEEPESCAKDLW